jgi:hypothetical protein
LQDTSEKATQDSNKLRQDQALKECEEYLKESQRLRDIATLMSKGKTLTGRINPISTSKKPLNKQDRYKRKQAIPGEKESKRDGIDEAEVQRRKEAGSVYAVPGPPLGKEPIGLRIVYDPLSWIQELPIILRLRVTNYCSQHNQSHPNRNLQPSRKIVQIRNRIHGRTHYAHIQDSKYIVKSVVTPVTSISNYTWWGCSKHPLAPLSNGAHQV